MASAPRVRETQVRINIPVICDKFTRQMSQEVRGKCTYLCSMAAARSVCVRLTWALLKASGAPLNRNNALLSTSSCDSSTGRSYVTKRAGVGRSATRRGKVSVEGGNTVATSACVAASVGTLLVARLSSGRIHDGSENQENEGLLICCGLCVKLCCTSSHLYVSQRLESYPKEKEIRYIARTMLVKEKGKMLSSSQ